METEGFYIGHSWYNGKEITCNNKKITVFPHDIKNIKVYNNTIINTGQDGFQVSCAIDGCEIFNNFVENYGLKKIGVQQAGIVIGGGTIGNVYNNKVIKGTGGGIHVFGQGNTTLFNNIIVNAGEDGIFIGEKTTVAGNYFRLFNNTIISPGRDGIRVNSEISKNNLFYNNLIVNPGSIKDYSNKEKAFIYLKDQKLSCDIKNNLFEEDIEEVHFTDYLNNDFHLQLLSPAVDKGKDIEFYKVNFDADYRIRPFNTHYDIGAYEYNSVLLVNEPFNENSKSKKLLIYPNPVDHETINIDILLSKPQMMDIYIVDVYGRKIQNLLNNTLVYEKNSFTFQLNQIKPGIYYIVFNIGDKFLSKRISIL